MRLIRFIHAGIIGSVLLAPPATIASPFALTTSIDHGQAATDHTVRAEPRPDLTSTLAPSLAPTIDLALRWSADDAALARGVAHGSWTWGPRIFRSMIEPYAEAPRNQRNVWYVDKARMEITQPNADPASAWYVSSGLLVRELISGQIQTGDARYQTTAPADVPIAGDLETPADQTITYRDLQPLASIDGEHRSAPRIDHDPLVLEAVQKAGRVVRDERFASYAVHLRMFDAVLGHNLAHVFTDALPDDKLLYLAGRPLTEPYWVTVAVNHQPTDVLVQAFERRILTYTPTNPLPWRVEWGNVGRQYAQWRYGVAESGPQYDPIAPLIADPIYHDLAELAPSVSQSVGEHADQIGVAVLDLRRGDLYSAGDTTPFRMYSIVKVPIMLGVLDQAQREGRELAPWEDELLRAMIQHSDNNAATILLASIGGAPTLDAYLRTLGLHDTVLSNEAWGDSATTPQDMARLIAQLGHCTMLNADLCQYALGMMRDVVPDQRWGVAAGTDPASTVAIKNGWSPDENGWTVNSLGLITDAHRRYAVVILTRGNSSKEAGITTIEGLAQPIHAALH